MSWTHGMRARLRLLFRRDAEERMDEEMRFHLEMETERHLREGVGPAEARRRALLAFGGVDRHKEAMRDGRTFPWAGGLSIDLKLGLRMMRKHPGLTLVGGVGMAFAIAVAAVFDATLGAASAPLPGPGGERIVALEVWDARVNNQEEQLLHDFATWKRGLRTVESLGAYRTTTRNLIVPGGSVEPVLLAEMTATGFGVAGVPPLLGRPLVESDEAAGAPPVAVLSHGLWRSRFGGDPGVVGREVRLGAAVHTVVGVMPEGFGFPLGQRLWVPLQLDPAAYGPREGPALQAFGRLATGATIDEAQAELTAVGRRAAALAPDTHRHLRPRVTQYGPHLMDDLQGWELPVMRALITLLLVIIAVNVAVLVFARTATRAGEITVRSALGASRRRIVAQFFAEALVLAGVSATVGLGAAVLVLRQLKGIMDGLLAPMGGLPYWMDFRLSPSAVLFAVGLAALAAVIVGVVPALRATGSRLDSALRALGGATGMRLGPTWSVLIVAQVAFTVAILPATVFFTVDFARFGTMDPGFPAEEYLTTHLVMSREPRGQHVPEPELERRALEARYAASLAEVERRLAAEPEVLAATFSEAPLGNEPEVRFDVEGAATDPLSTESAPGHPARYNRVDPAFFEAFELPALAGRRFGAGDLSPAASPVVVNRAFVRDVLGGGDALGRRIRLVEGYRSGGEMQVPGGLESGRWYEVVGVVGDLPSRAFEPDEPVAQVYRPLAPGSTYPLRLSIRTRGAPTAFAPRLRELAAAADPTLQARDIQPLETALRKIQGMMRMGALGLGILAGSVLLLSAAGIYALMSFTVTQRRREIGIRSALGAHPRRLLAGIFSRSAAQLGLGAAVGLAVAVGLDALTRGGTTGGKILLVVPAVAAIMLAVGLAAALGPARRGLRIQPMEALKADA
ncbi:MAG: ABC transporter permease [Gemmatimonadota bacterium]